MLSRRPRPLATVVVLSLLGLLALPSAAAPETVELTILQTSDLHGHLLAWDYQREAEVDSGFSRVATRVRQVRKERKNVLLLDAGDTIQGSPLQFLHVKRPLGGPDPTVAAMNALSYDAMAVGNHEFNFGVPVLRKAEREATFPWLSANTRLLDGAPAFRETLVRAIGGPGGPRVGILGLTTASIPSWEPEPNRPGLKWEDPVATARRLVPRLRKEEGCDFVVVLIHSGPEADLTKPEASSEVSDTGASSASSENRAIALARDVPGIDLLLTGHTHRAIPLTPVHGVPLIQPGSWGSHLARVDVRFERGAKSGWKAASVTGTLLASTRDVPQDPEVVRLAEPHQRRALAYLQEVVATAEDAYPADRARLEDTPLIDLINETQLEKTGADLSVASLLPGSRYPGLPKGPVRVKDLFGLYPYENQLVVIEVNGAMVKGFLETSARYFKTASWEDGRLVVTPNEAIIGYNVDMLQGATYRIDPFAPVGSRIKDLRVKGRPVLPDDMFTMAINSYRAQGGGGYDILKGARIRRVFSEEIRELLIERVRALGRLLPRTDRNWLVAPDAAWKDGAVSQAR